MKPMKGRSYMNLRPNCAICSSEISLGVLSEKDWLAELEYAREKRKRPRPFFCGAKCLGMASNYNCGLLSCHDDWCGCKRYAAGEKSRSELLSEAGRRLATARQAKVSAESA